MPSEYTLSDRSGKLRPACLFALLCLSAALPAAAAQKVVIPRAFRVVLSRTGVHTHADFLLFDTGTLNLLAMQRNPARFPLLTIKAHSSLPTDRAALPPDLAAFSSPNDTPLPNPYGPIDGSAGKPGWTPLPLDQNGRHFVKVLVPTRFANWLALQSPARRRVYLQPQRYTLVIRWE